MSSAIPGPGETGLRNLSGCILEAPGPARRWTRHLYVCWFEIGKHNGLVGPVTTSLTGYLLYGLYWLVKQSHLVDGRGKSHAPRHPEVLMSIAITAGDPAGEPGEVGERRQTCSHMKRIPGLDDPNACVSGNERTHKMGGSISQKGLSPKRIRHDSLSLSLPKPAVSPPRFPFPGFGEPGSGPGLAVLRRRHAAEAFGSLAGARGRAELFVPGFGSGWTPSVVSIAQTRPHFWRFCGSAVQAAVGPG